MKYTLLLLIALLSSCYQSATPEDILKATKLCGELNLIDRVEIYWYGAETVICTNGAIWPASIVDETLLP